MDITHTTYTMLVTIAHDAGAKPSTALLKVMVQRSLEEGEREFAGVCAAAVSVIEGDKLQAGGIKALGRYGGAETRVLNAQTLHKMLRA